MSHGKRRRPKSVKSKPPSPPAPPPPDDEKLTDGQINNSSAMLSDSTPPAPSEAEKRESGWGKLWRLTESNFFMGGGVGMAIAAYAFLIGGAPNFAVFLLVVSWLVMAVSIYRHNFFEGRSRRTQFIGETLVSLCVAFVLAILWFALRPDLPPREGDRVVLPRPAPAIRSDVQITGLRLRQLTFPQALIDVEYKNGSGVIQTDSAVFAAKAFFRPIRLPFAPEDLPALDDMFAESVRDADKIPKDLWIARLGPSARGGKTFGGKELMLIPLPEFVDGKKLIYFMGGILFSDSTGHYRKAFCYVLPPPSMRSFHDDTNYGEHWQPCSIPSMAAWEAKADEDTY